MENVESLVELLVDVQDGSDVTASVAVVGGRPDCDEVLVLEPVLEAVHHQLMRSGNQSDIVDVIEFSGNFRAEQPSSSSWGHCPGFDVFRVGPHEIAEWTLMRDLHSSIDESDLVDGLDFRGETTVDAEDFAFDHGTNAEVVEDFGAVLPRVGVSVLSNSFIIEAIYGSDLSGLMVASEESNVRRILEFEAQK